jgi:hypothetical protein
VKVIATSGQGEYVLRGVPAASVAGRHLFYNNSAYDGNGAALGAQDSAAIAPDKVALLPGETATEVNYSNYAHGINGVAIDLQNSLGINFSTADFTFRMGNTGSPGNMTLAPAPSNIFALQNGGANGSTRLFISWPDGAIKNTWLQVTVHANANTGLASPDVFYFGNAAGETNNLAGNTIVNGTDVIAIRNHAGAAAITSWHDLNRDGTTDAADEAVARANYNSFQTALKLVTTSGISSLGVSKRTTSRAKDAGESAALSSVSASSGGISTAGRFGAGISPVFGPLRLAELPGYDVPLRMSDAVKPRITARQAALLAELDLSGPRTQDQQLESTAAIKDNDMAGGGLFKLLAGEFARRKSRLLSK